MSGNKYINQNPEPVKEKKNLLNDIKAKKFGNSFRYNSLKDQLPFFGFLFLLLLIYITNAHFAEKKIRSINSLTAQLKELRWEYKSLKAELMYSTRESGVVSMMKSAGLKELSEPPIIIERTNESGK